MEIFLLGAVKFREFLVFRWDPLSSRQICSLHVGTSGGDYLASIKLNYANKKIIILCLTKKIILKLTTI